MERIWYDTHAGKLVVGETAVAGMHERLGNGGVVPLAELLQTPEFPFTARDFGRLDTRGWQREDYEATGRFVMQVLATHEDPRPVVTSRHLERLHKLGLGPEPCEYAYNPGSPFRSLPEFQMAIGSKAVVFVGAFEEYNQDDFDRMTKQLIQRLGRLPKCEDFDEAAAARPGKFPSYQIIRTHTDGLRAIFDRLGYPDIRSWDDIDYLHWGVRVMEANDGKDITVTMCNVLAGRKRGPSDVTTAKYFTTWQNYKQEVRTRYDQQVTALHQKLERYRGMVQAGDLPGDYLQLDDEQLVYQAARYLLVKALNPKRPQASVQRIAESPSYMSQLRGSAEGVTDGLIENTAVMLDVFDDIWPHTEYKQYLAVSDDEIAAAQERKILNNKRRRQNARAAG